MPRLSFLHSDQIYQFSQDKTFCWFKQAVALISHVGFMRCSGKTLLVSHVGFHALLCDVTALARSWTSSDGWFRGERPADRRALEGAVAKAGRVSFKRGSRDSRDSRAAHRRVVLNCPVLDIAHRRLVQSECRYGAEPRPCPGFLPSLHFVMKNVTFTHVLKLLSGLHIFNITTFVILLIHTFLQPFIQV